MREMIFTETMAAVPAAVYSALITELGVTSWLCDTGYIHAYKNGSYLFAWDSGYYASGQFTVLEQDQRVAFTWRGHGEPGVTRVEITLQPEMERTVVQLKHMGVGENEVWQHTRTQFEHGWRVALDNLKFLAETGFDRRIMRRPVLGIMPETLTVEIANHLGVPVNDGVHVAYVVEGGSAEKAGLRVDDVIVSIDRMPVENPQGLGRTLEKTRAGNTVEVVFYREGVQRLLEVKLDSRTIPNLPDTPSQLAETMHHLYTELNTELDALLSDIEDSQLLTRPDPDEWSAAENVAHLIWTEHFMQNLLWHTMEGTPVRWPNNSAPTLAGPMSLYPEPAELVAELKRAQTATVAMIAALPPEIVEKRYIFARIYREFVDLPSHHRIHFEQMRRAIETAS